MMTEGALLKCIEAIIVEIAAYAGIKYSDKRQQTKILNCIESYLQKSLKRFYTTKTLIDKQPHYFYKYYFPLGVSESRVENVDAVLSRYSKVVIVGGAGSGKSTILKHFFLRLLNGKKYIPVMIELRRLNESGENIMSHIKDAIFPHTEFKNEEILPILKSDRFVFLFDGYDELYGKSLMNFQSELEDLVAELPGNKYIMTSRPKAQVEYLSGFEHVLLKPLKGRDVGQFVRKQLPDNTEEALNVIESIKKIDNDSIRTFLTNPLVLSIYIVTYQSNSTEPANISDFYSRVVYALFYTHDSNTKIGWERQYQSNLTRQEIQDILKSFAYPTLLNGIYSFSRNTAVEILHEIKGEDNGWFDEHDYIDDVITAISIWSDDSGVLGFSHKSLHDYFCAQDLSEMDAEEKQQVYLNFVQEEVADESNVRKMAEKTHLLAICREIDSKSYLQNYRVPLLRAVGQKLQMMSISRYISYYFFSLRMTYKWKDKAETGDLRCDVFSIDSEERALVTDTAYFDKLRSRVSKIIETSKEYASLRSNRLAPKKKAGIETWQEDLLTGGVLDFLLADGELVNMIKESIKDVSKKLDQEADDILSQLEKDKLRRTRIRTRKMTSSY